MSIDFTTAIDFSKSVDVSDITDRVDELRDERDACTEEVWLHSFADEAKELDERVSILDELQGNGGDHKWEGNWYPARMIHESEFEAEMDQLVEDCYELPKLPSFISTVIDYAALKQDYTGVTVYDQEFYVR